MKVFVILKEGIYEQGIFGVCDSEPIALDIAEGLAESDIDDYHKYTVEAFEFNVRPDTRLSKSAGHFIDSRDRRGFFRKGGKKYEPVQ